jgi:hypothetical protein
LTSETIKEKSLPEAEAREQVKADIRVLKSFGFNVRDYLNFDSIDERK